MHPIGLPRVPAAMVATAVPPFAAVRRPTLIATNAASLIPWRTRCIYSNGFSFLPLLLTHAPAGLTPLLQTQPIGLPRLPAAMVAIAFPPFRCYLPARPATFHHCYGCRSPTTLARPLHWWQRRFRFLLLHTRPLADLPHCYGCSPSASLARVPTALIASSLSTFPNQIRPFPVHESKHLVTTLPLYISCTGACSLKKP
jgi:hypothetical protein